MENKHMVKKIIALLPNRKWVFVSLVMILGQAIFTLVVPLLTMNIIDRMSLEELSIKWIVCLIFIFVCQVIFSGMALYIMSYIGHYIVGRIRKKTWETILFLPVDYFDRNESGELMSRINNDTNILKDFVSAEVYSVFTGIISLVGSIVLLFLIDWKLALLMVTLIPCALLCLLPLGKKEYAVSKALQEKSADFQSNMNRVLSDIRLVKSSTAYAYEMKKGSDLITDLQKVGVKEAKILSFVQPTTSTVMILLMIVIIGYGSLRIMQGTLSAGVLVAAIFYLFQIASPLSQLSLVIAKYQKFKSAFERIEELCLLPIERQIISQSCNQKVECDKRLYLKNVSFYYDKNKNILKNINLEINIGKTTAIVGSSGAGKTTIFSLIERFYLPTNGIITYKGVNIQGIQLNEWRKKLAYVPQESTIMAGTLYDNLTYGLEAFNEQKLLEAIDKTFLKDFIDSLPNGIYSKVGERGIKLSGGQRQRVAIARAMVRDPEILLLDEATAHLDSISESLVQEALNQLMQGRTTVIIAHRLSTIKSADKIYVLEGGKIIGNGTHKELYHNNTLYKKFITQQDLQYSKDGENIE